MRPSEMVFWLDHLGDAQAPGVLCGRHADAIVVPRNWTLDDLRDPDLHLFRTPPATPQAGTRRRRTVDAVVVEALPLDEASAPVAAWTPSFDVADDLDGQLSATSPLQSRAFRGADGPRRR
jgi:hypothetical protein